jgi:hypothetical protein
VSDDKPTPRPTIPSPAALARLHPHPAATPAVAHSESARFGRVDDEGHVFVTVGDEEREVGSYPGATPDEALQYFARKYDELAASADLLEARLANPDVSAKEVADALGTLKEHVDTTGVVGDIPALQATVERVEAGLETKRAHEAEHRAAARAEATVQREAIVAEAEQIAGQPVASTQWKTSGERMRALLDQWKQHQRSGVKLDKTTESALWQRFSHARNAFDKARRAWFADLETSRAEARATKEALVAEAEELSTSTDWTPTARAFKQLMDRWRAAGRASRAEDDALWERFRAAQDAFFTAKDEISAAEDEEFRANLAVKEQLLTEADALLPVTDVEVAKSALRGIQDRWEQAGKVPRAELERVEKRMRRVETAVREADEQRWKRSNPEVAARARSLVDQLEASVASIEADLAKAEAKGDTKAVEAARGRLSAQQEWLTQARAGLDEFGG